MFIRTQEMFEVKFYLETTESSNFVTKVNTENLNLLGDRQT